MYRNYFKRVFDILISAVGLIVLSPLFVILSVVGFFAMGGNPFFVQKRPGKKDSNGQEVIFDFLKFRTMNNKKDAQGNLLPDALRLTRYGKFLRSTSLDELPQLINILCGDLSLVGPRALLVQYIERYTEEQRRRHDVRPGLTGLAQISGRNALSWEDKFELDIYYVDNISFIGDIKIILGTFKAVFTHKGISSNNSVTMEEFQGTNSQKSEDMVTK